MNLQQKSSIDISTIDKNVTHSQNSQNIHLRPSMYESSQNETADIWTNEETLKLLKAIETNSDNWDAISKEVGTKTKEQCILHFIRMPIEDHHIEAYSSYPNGTTQNHSSSSSTTDTKYTKSPLIALVELLNKSVDPEAASVAYNAVLNYYKNKTVEENNSEKEDNMEVEQEDLSMELKAAATTAITEATIRASIIVSKEEEKLQELVQQVIELQTKKIQLKLDALDSLSSE